jgi:hypothetical protein
MHAGELVNFRQSHTSCIIINAALIRVNSGKSKQLKLQSKALEETNTAYYNLNKACFPFLHWALSDFTAGRLS